MSITKSSTFTESSLPHFPAHKCAKWQGQPTSKIFWSLCTLRIFWRRLLGCPIIEFVLSEEYVTQLSQSNENVSLTLLHTSYICCAVEPLLIFGMSNNDVAISPESLSTYLTKTGKNWSCSLLVPSVNLYQRVNKSTSFRSPVICFATAPVFSICVVFV